MVRLKSAVLRVVRVHCYIWLLLGAVLCSTAYAETQYLYDDLGRLVVVAYPDGSAIAYEYDANGNIVGEHQWATDELTITDFNPITGPAGTQVTISGSGFYPAPSQNVVRVGGVPATVNSASESTLVISVPLGAQTGPISVETGGDVATSSENFVVLKPTIAGFSPAIVNPQDAVVLDGANLNLVPGSTSLSVGGAPASIVSLTNSQAEFEAPAESGKVIVDTSYGQAISASHLTVVPSSEPPRVFRRLVGVSQAAIA